MTTRVNNTSEPAGTRRRAFCASLIGAVAAPALGSAGRTTAWGGQGVTSGTVVASTTAGQVRGVRADGYLVFKGIPYAGSPGGAGASRRPPPLKPWTGVRDALLYGAQAIQPPDSRVAKGVDAGSGQRGLSVLNVWTQGLRDGRRRPGHVLFARRRVRDRQRLAPKYGRSSSATTDPRSPRRTTSWWSRTTTASGCSGTSISANCWGTSTWSPVRRECWTSWRRLRWVRENIADFGGDPDNVMIWGESGGGVKTATLTAMPSRPGALPQGQRRERTDCCA